MLNQSHVSKFLAVSAAFLLTGNCLAINPQPEPPAERQNAVKTLPQKPGKTVRTSSAQGAVKPGNKLDPQPEPPSPLKKSTVAPSNKLDPQPEPPAPLKK